MEGMIDARREYENDLKLKDVQLSLYDQINFKNDGVVVISLKTMQDHFQDDSGFLDGVMVESMLNELHIEYGSTKRNKKDITAINDKSSRSFKFDEDLEKQSQLTALDKLTGEIKAEIAIMLPKLLFEQGIIDSDLFTRDGRIGKSPEIIPLLQVLLPGDLIGFLET